jgi:hypothetical protein
MGKNRRLQRNFKDIRRRQGNRSPLPRVLIVTEGSKTEPLYLNDIRKRHRISPAHIRVEPSENTDPLGLVNFAKAEFEKSRAYDRIYAVFDRDEHLNYANGLARARALNNKLKNDERKSVPFIPIPSVPCFELWLLLHYRDVDAFFHRDDLIREVKRRIPGYQKGMEGVYEITSPNIGDANGRAARLRQRFGPDAGTDPYTDVDVLIAYLLTLAQP